MDKAYDLKSLGQAVIAEAKKGGLTIAEEAAENLAKSVYIGMKNWAKESAILSPNKVDDFIMNFYDQADPFVLPQIAKLDLDKDGD